MLRLRKFAVIALVTLGVLGAAGYFNAWRLNDIFGPRAWYMPSSHDQYLTYKARQILPLIAALDKVYQAKGAYPAESDFSALNDVASGAGSGFSVAGPSFSGPGVPVVYYWSNGSNRMSLSIKLGWDPSLEYSSQAASGKWYFSHGDGSDEEEPVALDIAP